MIHEIDKVEPEQDESLTAWAIGFLDRVGHVWVENPVSVVRFVWRLLKAVVVRRAGDDRFLGWPLWVHMLGQLGRTTTRGLVPAIGIGIVLAFAIGTVSRTIGSLARPLFDSTGMMMLLYNLIPLLLMLIVILRNGSSIAAKFASMPAAALLRSGRREDPGFNDGPLLYNALPHLFATTLSSIVLFAILVYFTVAGYLAYGVMTALLKISPVDVYAFVDASHLLGALGIGLLKSALYALIVSIVAMALGVQAGERVLSADEEQYEFFDAVWESSVTSLSICLALALLLWKMP